MSGTITNTAPSSRVLSIDVLRGLTIALMILVNDPGDWAHTYSQLDHAAWNGFTLTDLVFPNFLFLVGASIIFSLDSRISRGESRSVLALHILRRTAIILALDFFFNLYPHFHFTRLRVYGVLTRIALCYLAVALICLVTRKVASLLAIVIVILLGYWALMRFVPVPHTGIPARDMPILDPDNNWAAWIDRGVTDFLQSTIHTGRLYQRTRDPEGLLSTLPAIATTLLGSITALVLRRTGVGTTPRQIENTSAEETALPPVPVTRTITPEHCAIGLFLCGLLGLAVGSFWNLWFPINKNLWTSSYVLFAAGWALLALAVFYWLIDIRRLNETKAGKRLTFPWLVFGSNAIVAFCVSEFIVENMIWIKIPNSIGPNGKPVTAWFWIYHNLFAFHGSGYNTSLAFAIAFVAVCFIPNWLLYRKRIFLKI
jgi:predicted acyltransferase